MTLEPQLPGRPALRFGLFVLVAQIGMEEDHGKAITLDKNLLG